MDVYRLEVKLPYNVNRSLEKLRLELQESAGKRITKSDLARVIIESCLTRIEITKGK